MPNASLCTRPQARALVVSWAKSSSCGGDRAVTSCWARCSSKGRTRQSFSRAYDAWLASIAGSLQGGGGGGAAARARRKSLGVLTTMGSKTLLLRVLFTLGLRSSRRHNLTQPTQDLRVTTLILAILLRSRVVSFCVCQEQQQQPRP